MTTFHTCLRRTRCRFEYAAEHYLRAICDAAGYTAADGIDGAAWFGHTFKPYAVFEAFAGVDTHYRERQVGLELVEDRLACSDRQTRDAALDDTAYRIAVFLVTINRLGESRGIRLCADLYKFRLYADSLRGELWFGDTAGYYACGCLARTRPTAPAPVAYSNHGRTCRKAGFSVAGGIACSAETDGPGTVMLTFQSRRTWLMKS